MSRSGYCDDWDGDGLPWQFYRHAVDLAIKGKRGQAFLKELAKEMDAMPERALISGHLVTPDGACCTMGVICRARNIDLTGIDQSDARAIAPKVDIAGCLAAEIAHKNDGEEDEYTDSEDRETPQDRWERMRKWVGDQLGELPRVMTGEIFEDR